MTEDNDEYYTNNNQVITFGKFILVDLAGSEKITSARNYMDKAGDVMLSMGYSLIYGPEDISSGDKGIMVARFRRTFGAGDIETM